MTLSKSRFYALSFTWGIIMTLIGCIVSMVLIALGYKPIKNRYGWYFIVGGDWGGALDLGPASIVCENPTEHLLQHEFGHAVQNCYYGPAFPFIVAIPSAIRYWYREYLVCSGKKQYNELPPYDSIWFEGMATELGGLYEK